MTDAPWVLHVAVVGVVAEGPEGQLGHVELAQGQGAGGLQPRRRGAGRGADEVVGGAGPARGGQAGDQEEILVGESTAALGKSLEAAGLLDRSGAKVLALRRRDGTLHANPGGDLRLEEGDLVIALGTESQLVATAAMLK